MASGQPIQVGVIHVLIGIIIVIAAVEYCWRLIRWRALPVAVIIVVGVVVAVALVMAIGYLMLLLMVQVVHVVVANAQRVHL